VARLRRWWTPTPARIVVVLGLLSILLAALVVLLQSEQRRAGTNLTANSGFVIPLQGGEQLCEPSELVPGDTGALQLSIASKAPRAPRIDATIVLGSRILAGGSLAAGWRPGTVTIPISPVRETEPGATVCLVNRGISAIVFGGSVPDANFYVALGGRPLNGRLRIDYMRPGSESWLALLSTLVHRVSLGKSDLVRHWAAPAALLLMLLAIGLAVRTTLRGEPRR
jgi:hypothetical protein